VLGERVESVQSDVQQMGARVRAVARDGYTVHELSRNDGSVVREYVSSNGTVFGLAWDTPTLPNLRQLLGKHFADFQNAVQSTPRHRGPVAIEVGTLVVESTGHLRAFHGRAYLTDLVPANLSPAVVR
jgi:hypothetical protein